MKQVTDETWEHIAEQCIIEAERVKCSLADFAAGLKIIENEIRSRRKMAEDEAQQTEND